MAYRRPTWGLTIAIVALVAGGCSASQAVRSATPTTVHRRPPTPAPTTTTTGVPSATPTSVPAPVGQATGWSTMLTTLPPGGGFSSVACISDTFCVAAGGGAGVATTGPTSGSGVAVSWDGAAWSNPSVFLPAPATGPVTAPLFPSVACTSGPSCAIADGSGHLSTGDGTNWSFSLPVPTSGPAGIGVRTIAVDCPSESLCAMVDNAGGVGVRKDATWTGLQSFGPAVTSPTNRIGLSCPTESACTAVIGTTALDWNGSSWSKEPAPWIFVATGPTAISCPTTGLCAAVTGSSVSFRRAGGGWSLPTTIDGGGGLDAIACPTTSLCVAADAKGKVTTWNGLAWSPPAQVVAAPTQYPALGTSLACPTAQFCMVLSGDGDYATFNGGSPAVP